MIKFDHPGVCSVVLSRLHQGIDRLHKWRSKKYSFVFVLIRPTNLVLKEHFFCILSVPTRLVSLISIKRKEYFFGRHLCNRSMSPLGSNLFQWLLVLVSLQPNLFFSYSCMQTRLMAQYNGKRPISLVYVLTPLITVIVPISIYFIYTEIFASNKSVSDFTSTNQRGETSFSHVKKSFRPITNHGLSELCFVGQLWQSFDFRFCTNSCESPVRALSMK